MIGVGDFRRLGEIRRNSKEGVNKIGVLKTFLVRDAQSSSPTDLYAERGVT